MSHGPSNVVVIGSINIDLVVRAPEIPRPGQTVLGEELQAIPGGKGANQAVGAARLGAICHMVGAVGGDGFGKQVLNALRKAGVNTEYVREIESASTGAALITVNPQGENAICVAGGANRLVSPDEVDRALPILRCAQVCLLQLEVPLETILRAMQVCARHGVRTILDAAPALQNAPPELFQVDVLTANEGEAAMLLHRPAPSNAGDDRKACKALLALGARHVVLKLGSRGAVAACGDKIKTYTAHRVAVVDSTAAGDAFNAAMGTALALGHDFTEAVEWGNAAGALACTNHGAAPSMPALNQIEVLIGRLDEE